MTLIELKNLIASKLGIDISIICIENFKAFAVRFNYHGNTYRVTTDLNVEKVDGACLVTDSDARQLEKLLRGEQWDGTGLPPVGTECEVVDKDHNHIWHRCKILAHTIRKGFPCAVFENDQTVSCCSDKYFRPLRTERDKAIEKLQQVLNVGRNTHEDAENLYDAIAAGKIDGLGKVG